MMRFFYSLLNLGFLGSEIWCFSTIGFSYLLHFSLLAIGALVKAGLGGKAFLEYAYTCIGI